MSIEGTGRVATLYNIQALRAVAALLVVFAHLPGIELKHSPDQILPTIFMLGISGVDLFFVISGFIMVYVSWNAGRSFREAAKFLFARLSRIYPIYWVIAGALYLAWRAQPDLISFDPGATSLWRSFFLLPDQTFPMLKVAWTLIHELYFYVVFALCLLLPKRFLMPALTVWVVAILVLQDSGFCPLSPTWRLMINPMGLEFYFGAVIGWMYMRKGRDLAGAKPALVIGIVALMAAMAYQANMAADPFPDHSRRTWLFGLPAAAIVYGLVGMEASKSQPANTVTRSLSRIGDWSYALYLSHVLLLSVMGYIWARFGSESAIDNGPILIVMVVIATLISGVIYYALERPMIKAFRRVRERLFPRARD